MSAQLTAGDQARRASVLLDDTRSADGNARHPGPIDVARAQARALTSIALSLAELAELAREASTRDDAVGQA